MLFDLKGSYVPITQNGPPVGSWQVVLAQVTKATANSGYRNLELP